VKKNRVDESSPSFEDELIMMDGMNFESIDGVEDIVETQKARWARPASDLNCATDNLGRLNDLVAVNIEKYYFPS
jgi:hypothetical protein